MYLKRTVREGEMWHEWGKEGSGWRKNWEKEGEKTLIVM